MASTTTATRFHELEGPIGFVRRIATLIPGLLLLAAA